LRAAIKGVEREFEKEGKVFHNLIREDELPDSPA